MPAKRAALCATPVLSRFRMVAAVASFIIYASAVVALQQYRENFFYVERVGLAAAVSNVVYQAPFGRCIRLSRRSFSVDRWSIESDTVPR